MWQVNGTKVKCLTPGGLTDGWKQSMKPGLNKIHREKSAKAIVPEAGRLMGRAELDDVEVNEGYQK
jgi:hypothetical protein